MAGYALASIPIIVLFIFSMKLFGERTYGRAV